MTPEPAPGSHALDRGAALLIFAAIGWGFALLLLAIALPTVTPQTPSTSAPGAPTSSVSSTNPPPPLGPAPAVTTEPRVSLVHHDGYRVLIVTALPALAAAVVGIALRSRAGTTSQWPAILAWSLSAAVLITGILGFLTILFLRGLAIVPIGLLLIAACARTAPHPAFRRHATA